MATNLRAKAKALTSNIAIKAELDKRVSELQGEVIASLDIQKGWLDYSFGSGLAGILGLCHDLAYHRQTEPELRRLSAFARMVMDAMPREEYVSPKGTVYNARPYNEDIQATIMAFLLEIMPCEEGSAEDTVLVELASSATEEAYASTKARAEESRQAKAEVEKKKSNAKSRLSKALKS